MILLNQTASDIGRNIEELIKIIYDFAKEKNDKSLRLILLSPPYVDESVSGVKENYSGAEEKSKKLAGYYEQVASKYNCDFIDIAQIVKPSKIDGYHLDPEAHATIAEALARKIKGLTQ